MAARVADTNMNPCATTLHLVIVSEDWFARCLLESLAAETGQFAKITSVDDGYSALAEAWEGVATGATPNVFLVDGHTVGASCARMVTELRADPRTQHVYIALLTPDEPVARDGIDFASPCVPGQPEIGDVISHIASRATSNLPRGRAA